MLAQNENNDTLKKEENYSFFRQNFHDACLSHMASNGIPFCGQLIADGEIHRFSIDSKSNQKDEFYAFHAWEFQGRLYSQCYYGTWSGGQRVYVYKSYEKDQLLSYEELNQLREGEARRQKEFEARQKQEKAQRLKQAITLWESASQKPLTTSHSTYLEKKGIRAFGIRYSSDLYGNPVLVIPITNIHGEVRAIQYIREDGDKRIHGLKRGNFHIIGEINNSSIIFIAEGYATAASAYEAEAIPVVVAFDCGNLDSVIGELRKKYPSNPIVILADDDQETARNPGKTKAMEAAAKHRCKMITPIFPPDFRLENGKLATDFNDLHVNFGLYELKRQMQAVKISQDTVSEKDWPKPNPIKASLYPVPSFDQETLLPEVLCNWIMDEANRMPCPPEFISASVIVFLGSIIGAQCAVKPKANDPWVIVPNLWGGVVGLPSSKKSPAISVASKPLGRLIALAEEQSQKTSNEFSAEKIIFDARKDAIESKIKSAAKEPKKGDITSLTHELQVHLKNAPKAPIERRYKSNDTTIEKLGELLKDNPTGLLILRDELVGLLASWDKAGHEGDRAFYLEAWNGNTSFDTDRIGRGHIYIQNLCASLFGGIQPDKLTIYLEQSANALANDGMLQRFQILVYPDHRKWEWCDFFPNREARDKAYAVFDSIGNFNPMDWGAFPKDDYIKFPYFQFDEEAQQIFIEWATELNQIRIPREDNPLIAQHLAKYEKLFSGLSLIFHLVDCATSETRGSVGVRSALRAAAWCKFLEAHARRCYGLIADDGLRSAQALASKLCQSKLKSGFTARDVRRNQWRYLTTDEAVQAALDWLEDEGWLCSKEVGGIGPGTGRRTFRYDINPKIKNIEQAKEENDELA